MQDGRPERAREVLSTAAATLDKAPLGEPAAFRAAEAVSGALGRTAINARGETLGVLKGLRPGDDGRLTADVSMGGLLGLGGTTIQVKAEQVLLGCPYVALATEAAADVQFNSNK